ncbi:MAG: hypothetical protein QM734_07855 [Cyclobacteriaceae bacterium]
MSSSSSFRFYLIFVWKRPNLFNVNSSILSKVKNDSIPSDDINRVLISKFKILRGDTHTDFLAVSLPEAIANALIGIKKLRACKLDKNDSISNFSNQQLIEFSNKRKLNAILTGSILAIDDQVRISTTLVEQPSNSVVWTESTQSLVGDLFELQDLISRKIIKSLELKLSDEERLGMEKKNTKSPEAYELFLKANELSHQVDKWRDAKDVYISCLEKDPTFSSAMARLARCYRVLGKYHFRGDDSIRYLAMSEAYISHSLRLDPQSDLAIGIYTQLLVDNGKSIEALKTLVKRINVSNSNAHLFASLVHVLRFSGLLTESIEADRVARSIDSTVLTSIGHTHFMLQNYSQAKEFIKGDIGYLEAVSLSAMNLNDEAIDKLKINESRVDSEQLKAYLRSLKFALMGDKQESLRNLEIAFTDSNDAEALYYLVRTYAYLGEEQLAIDGLTKVVEKGYYQYMAFESDPWLESIRTHDAYKELLEQAIRLSAESVIALQSITINDANLAAIFKIKQDRVLA